MGREDRYGSELHLNPSGTTNEEDDVDRETSTSEGKIVGSKMTTNRRETVDS